MYFTFSSQYTQITNLHQVYCTVLYSSFMLEYFKLAPQSTVEECIESPGRLLIATVCATVAPVGCTTARCAHRGLVVFIALSRQQLHRHRAGPDRPRPCPPRGPGREEEAHLASRMCRRRTSHGTAAAATYARMLGGELSLWTLSMALVVSRKGR